MTDQTDLFQRNRRYDHAYAIVRVDSPIKDDWTDGSAITVQKIVWSQKAAESEAVRLNKLNADKGAYYFWQLTRIERTSEKKRLEVIHEP